MPHLKIIRPYSYQLKPKIKLFVQKKFFSRAGGFDPRPRMASDGANRTRTQPLPPLQISGYITDAHRLGYS